MYTFPLINPQRKPNGHQSMTLNNWKTWYSTNIASTFLRPTEPFTQEPLCTLINDNCTSKYAQQILSGTAQIENLPIDKYTKDLLHHLKAKMSPNEQHHQSLDPELLTQGFKKWPK